MRAASIRPFSLLAPLLACGPKAQSLETLPLSVAGHTVTAEIADSAGEREIGLMHRKELAPEHGMLFVYPEAKVRHFWMKNTLIPLSIAYLNAEGRIVHTADMDPLEEAPVSSVYPATYALEMSRGWFVANGVNPGDVVTGLPAPATAEP